MDAQREAARHRLIRLRHQRLGEKPERPHRRLQLVAHVRDEVPPDLFQPPAFGDVVDDRDDPEGTAPVVDDLRADGEGAPGRPVEIEDPRRRPFAPRVGEKLLHRLRRQRITVATTHHRVGAGVAEDVLAVLVADDHALGKRVESAPEPDGVRRRLLHRLGRVLDPVLDVAERSLDAPPASLSPVRPSIPRRDPSEDRRCSSDRRPERRPSMFADDRSRTTPAAATATRAMTSPWDAEALARGIGTQHDRRGGPAQSRPSVRRDMKNTEND